MPGMAHGKDNTNIMLIWVCLRTSCPLCSARLRLPKSTPPEVVEEFVQEVRGCLAAVQCDPCHAV